MAINRHLDNAPIAEAIIDLRVQLPSSFRIQNFEKLNSSLKAEYPSAEERHKFKIKHTLQKGNFSTADAADEVIGYILKSKDGKNIVQFRNDGFTFSRLKPYSTWSEIFAEAKKLWSLYIDNCSPVLISRIATRYINHLDIPLPVNDFSKYLTCPPVVPEELTQHVSGFLSRTIINDPKLSVSANITQALEKSLKENHITVILDIDVYKNKNFNINDDMMWQNFDTLHLLKNDIFFSYLTDDILKEYE